MPADEYRPNLLYEISSITPHGHEFWFENREPSQRIYVHVEPPSLSSPSSTSTTSSPPSLPAKLSQTFPLPLHESEKCAVTADHDNTLPLAESLTTHLTSLHKRHPELKLPHLTRLGISLKQDGSFSNVHPPPSLSENAIWSPPEDVPKVPLSAVKVLETREIRRNVRIARLQSTNERCIFKNVEFRSEAVGLSFEVSNYKSLMAKGVGGWIPRLLALVYVRDDGKEEEVEENNENAIAEDDDDNEKDKEEKELKGEGVHFIGAAFEFFAQKDLTQHYTGASTSTKLSWTRQLVSAIAALEAADFEHWDLKCENLVLDTTPPPTAQHDRRGSTGSISHAPTEDDPGRIKVIDLENNKASSAWKVGENTISMVYSMGKTVLEMFEERFPDAGKVKGEELGHLPEPARTVVEMCCYGDEVPTARSVAEKIQNIGS